MSAPAAVIPAAAPPPATTPPRGGSPLLAFFLRQTGEFVTVRRMVWGRPLFILIAGAFFLLGVDAFDWVRGFRGIGQGRLGFSMMMVMNAFVVFALINSYFCKVITIEREAGSLDLLRITGLSSLALLIGKGTSQFARAMLLLLAQAPLCALCIVLGGISLEEMVWVCLLLAAVLFCGCHLGVYCSVVSKTSRHASHNTVGILMLIYFSPRLVLLLQRVLGAPFAEPVMKAVDWWAQVNPFTAYFRLMSGGPFPVASILVHFGLGVVALLFAARAFERVCETREIVAGTGAVEAKSKPVRKETPPRLVKNPLTWKEYYFTAGGRRGTRGRWGLFAILTVLIFWLYGGSGSVSDVAWVFFIAGMIGLVGEVAHASSKILGAEVTQRTLGDLATLPMSMPRIIWEKCLGHVPSLLPSLTFVLASGLVVAGRVSKELNISEGWLLWVYLAVQVAFTLVFTVRTSLVSPASAFGYSLVVTFLGNSLGFGFMAGSMRIPPVVVVYLMMGLTIAATWRFAVGLPDKLMEVAAK